MTKLQQVYKFVNDSGVFKPMHFTKKFGKYPNTYWTYLTYLKRAQYVIQFGDDSTMTVCNGGPAHEMSERQLKEEAYGKKKMRRIEELLSGW
jgi:hypothetical protein